MKKLLYVSCAFVLFSCSENGNRNSKSNNPNNVIEEAESSASSSLSKSGSRYGGNMVDDIFGALLDKDENLKKLDEKILNLQKESSKVISENEKVISKSAIYYVDAKSKTESISDSLTKKGALEMIKQSSDRFDLKTQKLRELLAQAKLNGQKIDDSYTIFKIKKTIPEIEKYQNDNPIELNNLNNYINRQTQLLAELQKL